MSRRKKAQYGAGVSQQEVLADGGLDEREVTERSEPTASGRSSSAAEATDGVAGGQCRDDLLNGRVPRPNRSTPDGAFSDGLRLARTGVRDSCTTAIDIGNAEQTPHGRPATLARFQGAVEPPKALANFDQAMLWALSLVRPLTVPEAAYFLRMREKDVVDLIEKRELRGFKRGRRQYVLVEDVRARLIQEAEEAQAKSPRTARIAVDMSGASDTMRRLFA